MKNKKIKRQKTPSSLKFIMLTTLSASIGITGCENSNYQLTISKAGTGQGTVLSNSEGIDCGDTCTFNFQENEIIILTASTTTESEFSHWSGACEGTESSCEILMDEIKNVTAFFESNQEEIQSPLFQKTTIVGVTDTTEGTNGIVLTDINRDDKIDILGSYSAKGGGSKIRMFINKGDMNFEEQNMSIISPQFDTNNWGLLEIPNMADLNNDGFLDIFLTRDKSRRADTDYGNSLLISQGNFHTFKDMTKEMGVVNLGAGNHGSSFGDVNQDGWLDIGVGAVNIGNLSAGVPSRRLYIYQPKGNSFEQGSFKNIGGDQALLPDFGGDFGGDLSIDKSSKGITLIDLDNDGDLDLLQGFELDTLAGDPASIEFAGYYKCGIYIWRNMLKETGVFGYERIQNTGIDAEAQFVLDVDGDTIFKDPDKKTYYFSLTGDMHATSMTFMSTADIDNDGLIDILVGGPADDWHMEPEKIVLKLWRNRGNFSFEEVTLQSGLDKANQPYSYWWPTLFGASVEQSSLHYNRQLFSRGGIFGDYNNDGWEDLIVLDSRQEGSGNANFRNLLFLNNGDGTFSFIPPEDSGIDTNGISGVAADINGDGLLDFYSSSDPINSSGVPDTEISDDRFYDYVYLNTGGLGGANNHWLDVRLSGKNEADLIGAKVYLYEPGTVNNDNSNNNLISMRVLNTSNHVKSGQGLTLHFGLASRSIVDIKVVLLDGKSFTRERQEADDIYVFNLE